jgi:hypothetical protein
VQVSLRWTKWYKKLYQRRSQQATNIMSNV